MTVAEVRPYQGKKAIVRLLNGEVATVQIIYVDAEYEDIIVDVVQTNRPENYQQSGAAYAISVADIISVEEISDSPTTQTGLR